MLLSYALDLLRTKRCVHHGNPTVIKLTICGLPLRDTFFEMVAAWQPSITFLLLCSLCPFHVDARLKMP
jgi:hypothetical protein